MSTAIDIAELQKWAGRTQSTEDIATRAKSAGLAATLDYDEDPWGGFLFPLAHWLHFTPEAPQHELSADGHPHKGGFLPPVPLPRRMWAASDVTFHRPVRVGDELREVQTIRGVEHKSGRSGDLVFLRVDREVYAAGEHAITDEQTIVFREATEGQKAPEQSAAERAALTPADASDWDYSYVVAPNETQLFRYSGLTFNAHRIHYDRDYCIEEEGYPGLVVHGPLSATLLVDAFMRNNPGVPLRGFSFQARSPIFDNTPVAYVGRRASESTFDVAALNPEGTVCLKGTITI